MLDAAKVDVAKVDVAVIGGGPAGLATAIGLRLDGLDVHVFEKSQPPIDKACGEGLMPDGVEALQRLGIRLDPRRTHAFHGISYVDGEVTAEGRFPRGEGIGVRRTLLHEVLIARAEQVGVELHWRTKVDGPADEGIRVGGETIPCSWIVGADGLLSRVRRWIGNPEQKERRARFGVRRHYRIAPWTEFVEIHLGEGCEAYVTPVARDETGVAILWSGRKASFDELMEQFPRLRARLADAALTSSDRGMGPLRQTVKVVAQGRTALVGDASGYIDALTGEGLALAFRQAEVLREAIGRGDLRGYARAHRRVGRRARIFTEALLGLERRPWLRSGVVRILSRNPRLFDAVLRHKMP